MSGFYRYGFTGGYLTAMRPNLPPPGSGGTPTPAPPPGALLWLKADAGITQAGGTVSAWDDQSGHGHDFVQATGADQPAFVASSNNGLPGVNFGAATFMTSALTPADGAKTVVFVFKQTVLPTNTALQAFDLGTTGFAFGYARTGWSNYNFAPDDVSSFQAAIVGSINTTGDLLPHALVYAYNGGGAVNGSFTIALDGADQAVTHSGSNTHGANGPNSTLGGAQGAAGGLSGVDFNELLLFGRALSAPDMATLQAYVLSRYAL